MAEERTLHPALAAIVTPSGAVMGSGMASGGVLRLDVRIPAPDLRPFLGGNALPGVWSFAAASPGPHVAVVALTHGNEIGGALVLDRWLRAGLRPARGRLSLVFANIDAYGRFDPEDPTASRFIDEDLNRLWDVETLDGGRRSLELRRARVLRPLFDTVDVLLDLHSMLWPSEPLMLVGHATRAAELALRIGVPPLVVADDGHLSGRRLIDYAPFSDARGTPAAVLVEAGSHWEPATVATMEATGAAVLLATGVIGADGAAILQAAPAPPRPRLAEVTRTVTAQTTGFAFVQPFRGGDVVPRRNTLIALDGDTEIRSPHDDCLMVMPSLRTMPGQTAVRLARFMA